MSDRATAEDLMKIMEVSPVTGLEGDTKSDKVTQNVAVDPATAEDLDELLRGGAPRFAPLTGGGVGTLDPTTFDFQLSVDGDNEERRAQEQNFFASVGKGAGRLVGTTATKFLQGIGYTVAGIGALAEQDIDVMLDNGFSALMSEAEEGIKEALPIYQTEKARDPRFWRSMWTHDFWFNDVVDGAAFMLSSIIGAKGFNRIGKGIGGYTKIAKEASKLTRAAKLGKIAQGMTSNAANIVDDMNLLTMTAFNSVSEAAFEAKDLKDQLRQQLELDVQAGLITQEEANARASQAAKETFGLNILTLMPSNYLTNSFIFKKADRLGNEQFSNRMALEAFGKSALTSMISEGAYEENIQLAIQDYASDKAKGKQVGPWYEAIAKNWANNFTTSEGQKSILLGALIGLIPGGVGGVREAKQERELAIKTNAFLASMADHYEEGINYFYKRKTEKNEDGQVVESGEFELDKSGNPVIDTNKVQAVFEAKYREFADFVGAMKAANNGNDVMYDYIQSQRIAQLGFSFYGAESGIQELKDMLSAEKEKEAEMLRDSGKEVNEEQLRELEREAHQKAEDYHKLYNYINQKFIQFFDFGKGKAQQEFKNNLLVEAFTKGVDQQYWESAKTKIENQISDLERKGEGKGIYDQINPADKKELSKLKEQLKQVNEQLEQSYVDMKDLLNEDLQKANAEKYAKDQAANETDVVDSEITDDAATEIINKTEQQTPDGANQQAGVNQRTPKPVGKFRVFDQNDDIVDLNNFDEVTANAYGYEKDPESNTYVLNNHKEGLKHTVVTNENGDVVGDVAAYDKQAIKEGEEISVGISFADNKLSSIKTKDKDGDIQDYGIITKEDGTEYTLEDLPILLEDLKDKHGIEVSTATKDDSINLGDGGTVETIAKNERRDPNELSFVPEYGVRHSGSAVAYVWKDQTTGAYVTLNEDFHKEVINLPAEEFDKANFKAVVDVNNKEWAKFPKDIKEALIRPNLTDAEIDNLLALENVDSFNNVVDRVPIRFDYSRGDVNIPNAGFIHDTAYDFISIPESVLKEGDAAVKQYKLQEKLRTRKVRNQILRKLLKGEEFVFDGSEKSMGHYNSDGQQKNLGKVLDSVEQELDSTSVGLAVDTGLIYMDGKETAIGAGIPGNVFINTNKTANGDSSLVKVSPAKVSKEHAQIIYNAITQAYRQGSGGFKAKYEGKEVTGDLTRKEVLDMLVHWGKETVIDLTDPTQKAKSYLSSKQLYADVKTRTLNFGKESIPLFGATQAEIDHFVTYVSENKNYTVSKKLTGKTLPKSFSIGTTLSYNSGTNQTYNGMLLRSGMLTTDLIKVEGTKSLFKQPAVVFDVLGANMDFSTEKVDDARVKAVEKQSALEAKSRQPVKKAAAIKTPEKSTVAETKPKVEKKPDTPKEQRVDSDVAIKSLSNVQDFNKVANKSLIFFRKDDFKSKLGSVIDGWFVPTKQAADSDAQSQLDKIGAFKLSDSKKMAEFDKKFGGFFNWIFASQPVAPPEPPATEQEKKDDANGQMKDSNDDPIEDAIKKIEEQRIALKIKKEDALYHGGQFFEKFDKKFFQSGEFSDPQVRRIAQAAGVRQVKGEFFFTPSVNKALTYASRYGKETPTIYIIDKSKVHSKEITGQKEKSAQEYVINERELKESVPVQVNIPTVKREEPTLKISRKKVEKPHTRLRESLDVFISKKDEVDPFSTSTLQQRLRISFKEANTIVGQLKQLGLIYRDTQGNLAVETDTNTINNVFSEYIKGDKKPPMSIDDVLPIYRSTTYAPENYKVLDLQKELNWLNSNFRQDRLGRKVTVEEKEKLIDLGNNRHAFGEFTRDSIIVSKLAEEGTVYHEAFHRVSLGYLKDKQRKDVYNDARKKYNLPEATDKVVDERLAEEYRKYAMNRVENVEQDKSLKGHIKAFFKGLYDFLYTWFTGNTRLSNNDVESLFEAISEGKFKFAQINKDRYEALKNKRYRFEIKGVQFNHIETYPQSKEVIGNMFKLLMESSGLVKTNPKTGEVEDILISDLKDVGNINLGKLYETLIDKSNRLRNVAKNNAEQAPLATKIANMFDEIIINQDAMNKALIDHMRVLDIRRTDDEVEIDEITGAGRSELSDFGKSMFESSAKDNTAATIKLFISMLPASNVRSSETGLISLVDFGKTWGRLYYLTEGSLNVEDMMEKIKKASDDNFTYKVLYDKLIKDENLKTQFYVTMNKQNLNFIDAIVTMEDGGTDVTFLSSKMQQAVSGLTRDWSSDFFLKSKFVVHGKGSAISFNPEAYEVLISQYNDLLGDVVKDYKNNGGTLANFNDYSTRLSNIFKEINIPLDDSALTVMLRDKDVDISKGLYELITKDLARVFNTNSGIYKHLLGVKKKGVTNETILTAESATVKIADAYARSGEFDMGNTVLGPDGNRYYTIASNTYISDTMKRLKSEPLEIEQRLSANYNKGSRFLTTLKNNPNALELVIQSAFRRTDSETADKGREYQALTELEDYLTRVNAIRKGYLLPPTPADRKFYYFYKGMEKVDVTVDADGNFNKDVIDVYQKYYEDEVRRINAVRQEIEDTLEQKLDHEDLYEFYHYTTKKPKVKQGDVLVTFGTNKHVYIDRADGTREWLGRGSNFSDFNGFNLNWSISQVRSAINDLLKDKLDKEIKYAKKIGVLERFGEGINNNLLPEAMLEEISEEMFGTTEWEENKDAVLRNALADFLVNTAVGVFESNKVFTGDPAAFKSTEDELKRLTGYTSTGDNLRTEFPAEFFEGEHLIHQNDYNITYFNSHEFESSFYDEVYEEHTKAYIREGLAKTEEEAQKLATKRLGALKGVDQTDGQTLISPEMYRAISIRLGEWPKWKEDAYQILQKDPKDVSYEEQLLMNDIVMQPLKMTYMKVEYINGNAVPIFDKMSLATVFRPIYRGTALEKLIDRMELKGEYANKPDLKPIHQVKFHTATKTGIKDRRSIYKDATEKEWTDFNVLAVYPQDFAYLRRQLVTDPHHADHVLAGSQMQKVGVSNVIKDADYVMRNEKEPMKGEDLLQHFNQVRGELSDIGRRKYLSDMGVNKELKFIDEAILLEKMREEALNSGMPDYIAESYSTNEKGEKLVEFDALPGNRKWTEARFLSANKKATIDLNLPGNVFIQMTDIGLEKIQRDGTKDPETRLKMMNDKGYMEGKVSVSLFRTLIPNYDGITDEERIHYLRKHPELVSLGYRIPTQGPNSIYMIEVVDFLPASAGDIVLLPGEGTALGGFDFDIDKLYILRHNYDRTNKIIEYKTDENSTVEQRYIDWVNDNANRDTIKYMNHLKRDQLNAVKQAYKGRMDAIKEWLGGELQKNKSATKDHLNMQIKSIYNNVKDNENTIYLEELYTAGNRLFDHLSPNTKENYYDLRDSLNAREIKGVARLMEFTDYTTALLASNHPDSDVLKMMIDNYQAQMVAFGMEESYIKDRENELKTLYIDEYKQAQKEGRTEIFEQYDHLKQRLVLAKSGIIQDLNLTAAKQIAKFSELPTLETFTSYPEYKQNVRKALENRLLDMFFGVGKSEHSYILKTTPLGFAGDVLKQLSKTVRAKSGIESAFSAPLDRTTPRFQMDVKARFKFGGKGIGPMALANVHHIMGQMVDLGLFTDLGIGNEAEDGSTSLSGILGVDNEYITEWISALIDAHVDLAADPYIYYLNANDITNDVLLLLIRAGVGGLNSFKFIAQPSLVEVAQLSENNNNKLDYKINKPLNEVIRKYEKLMNEKAQEEGYKPVKFDPSMIKDIFVPSRLDAGLDAIGIKPAEWYNFQLNVLKAFDYLDKNFGKPLSATVMASRVDTKKFGSNTSEYINYTKTVNQALADSKNGTGIRNFDKLLESTYLSEMMDNSIYLVNDILKDHILEASPQFIKITEQILRKNGTEFANRVDDMISVANEVYTAISAGFFKENGYLTRKSFINMISGENSIPRQISKLKTDNRFKDNLLLQSLSPIYEEGKPHFLFARKPDDAGEKDAISRDWGRLAAYTKDPKIQTFAKELFVYSYITSGFRTGLHTFFDLVPTSLIVDMGYNDYIKQALIDYNNPEYTPTFLDEVYINGIDVDAVVPPLSDFQKTYVEEENRIEESNGYPYALVLKTDAIIGRNKNKEPFGKPYIKYKHRGENLLFRYEGYRGEGEDTELLYKFSPKKSRNFKGGHRVKETLSDVTVFKANKYPFSDAVNGILDSNMLIPFFNQKVANRAGFTPYIDLVTTDITVEEIGEKTSDNIKSELSYNPIQMQPDNIEKIKEGKKVITNRSSETLEGWSTMPDGSIVHLTNLGYATITPGAVGVLLDTGEDFPTIINKDNFAQMEGFENWADFEKNNKFSKNFIEGNTGRYIYQITYYGNRIPTPEEVEQHKKECNG